MILLTGARGFLGSAMAKHLQACFRNHRTEHGAEDRYAFAKYDYPYYTIIDPDPWAPAQARFQLEDVPVIGGVREGWVKACDSVIHMAATADLNLYRDDPAKGFRVNIEGTQNVARACAAYGKRLVFVSTCCVYGNAGRDLTMITEHTEPEPTEAYAWSKLAGEHLLAGIPNLDYVICRIGTMYGPGMRPALFNSIALRNAAASREIKVHGDGKQRRQYLYIDDACAALEACLFKGQSRQTYNACGNISSSVSVMETITTASKVTGGSPRVSFMPHGRQGQIESQNISCLKLHDESGWEPKVGYEEGMARTWAWLKEARDAVVDR